MRRVTTWLGATVLCGALSLGATACGSQVAKAPASHATLDSVLTHPTLRAVITETGGRDSQRLAGDELVITMSNPSGKALSSGTDSSDRTQLAIERDGVVLGELRMVSGAAYLRLDPSAIESASGSSASEVSALVHDLQGASRTAGLGFLRTVADGGWVGLSEKSAEALIERDAASAIPDAKPISPALVSAAESNLKALLSARSLGERDGEQVSSVTVRARSLLGAMKPLLGAIPGLSSRATTTVPADLSVTLTMWARAGNLVALRITRSNSNEILDVAISYPATSIAAPSDAVMINLSALAGALGGAGGHNDTGSNGLASLLSATI
jgi:hypothetical protein